MSDAKAWKEYALAREGCVELASTLFPSQTVFDTLEKMYNLPDLDDAPIQARAAALESAIAVPPRLGHKPSTTQK